MESKVNFKSSEGDNVVGILSNTGKKNWVVLFVHGFNSTKNHKHFLPIIEELSKKEISTFRFDTFGQGESDGKLEDLTISRAVDDTVQAIKYLENLGYLNIGIVGTSFGGFVSLVVASKYNKLKFLALKSPVSDYLLQINSIASDKDIENWKNNGFVNYRDADQFVKLNYSFYEDIKNYDIYESLKALKIPVLIVHGTGDKTVSVDQSMKLSKLLRNSKLETIINADHGYSNLADAEKMRSRILDFILNQISSK